MNSQNMAENQGFFLYPVHLLNIYEVLDKYYICSDTTKPLISQGFEMVLGDGIEPPTRGFSVLCSTN